MPIHNKGLLDYGWDTVKGIPQLVFGKGRRPQAGAATGAQFGGAAGYVPGAFPDRPVASASAPGAGSAGVGGDNAPPVNQPYSGESPEFIQDLQGRFQPQTHGDITYGNVTSGLLGDRLGNLSDRQRRVADSAVNTGIDAVTGLPFGIASTLLNPQVRSTPWGSDFNVGGGGLAGIGGRLSYRNLSNIYGDALAERAPTGETDPNYLQEAFGGDTLDLTTPGANQFFAPGTIPSPGFGGQTSVTTPLATSPALGGALGDDWRVISGNTDLALQQNPHLDINQDGQLSATELQDYHAAEQQRQAQAARQAELDRLAEQDRALAEAARQREAEAEAARQAELSRQQQQAAEAAARAEQERINRERAAAELAASNAQRESEGRAPQRGSPVTDRHGNAVRDSSGGIVTDRPTDHGGGDSGGGGGGGGGGTWCCTAAMKQGMPIKKIKELRKWHRQQSQLWQNGYDRWGKFIADNVVKGSPFWASVTEAGHTLFVEKKLTPKSALAWLMIAPGSYIAGGIDAVQKRVAKKVSLGEQTGDSSEVGKQI